MRRNLFLSTAMLSAAFATSLTAQSGPGPCFDPNVGTSLGLGDDTIAAALPLQFSFPIQGTTGVTTNLIDVSSNGAVYLESGIETSARCCTGDPAIFLAGVANISVWWQDLQPNSAGDVFFNATANKALVTWVDVPEYNGQGANTVQLQMFPDGSFQIAFQEITQPGTHSALVGFTPGNGAVDPGESDLSILPIGTGAEPTIYEFFDINSDVRDLDTWGGYFIPNASGGWDVIPLACASSSTYGLGCPNPITFYELFDLGQNDLSGSSIQVQPNASGTTYAVTPAGPGQFRSGYTNNLLLADDGLATSLALGFTIPVPGAGAISAIDVCSNGWAAPTGLFTVGDYTETVDEFLMEPTRWAPCWDDFNPASGGGVYFDIIGGVAVVTWDQVPQFNNSDANTFQLQIRPDGSFLYVWQNVADDSLVGFSVGNGVTDFGGIDISNDLPVIGSIGNPLLHAIDAPPSVGASATWSVANIPAGAALTAINFGVVQLALDLGAIGAPGCAVYASAEVSVPVGPPTNGISSLTLTIPNTVSLIGTTLYTQGVVAGVAANTLGVISSNGVINTFGN